ncbi:branched-chain amino acid aminotransferase II [Neoconidiobolus thromboides FSU 785]|nr:branched-chain amino acid aminotransferase II [Neoconidiobolus thromboides FSU 785]
MQEINKNNIKIEVSKELKPLVPNEELQFGKTFSDHMLSIEWDSTAGWDQAKIQPYQNLSLDPSALVFHYGIECFEGLKAYKTKEGKIILFRALDNMKRLNDSCKRLTLPTFNEIELLEVIKKLILTDQRWIPDQKGYSLYIRPTVIATQSYLGVASSNKALLYVICSPVGPYYPTGFQAVRLYATKEFVRAWPGGTGSSKIGGNYGPGLLAQNIAKQYNCQQNLWLFGEEESITEVGTMNLFLYYIDEQKNKVLKTPPLDGTILPGVTRASIVELMASDSEIKMVEGSITMKDVIQLVAENRLLEMFGTGTACIISPIKEIYYKGDIIRIPLDENDSTAQAGPLASKLFNEILSIQYGEKPSEWVEYLN